MNPLPPGGCLVLRHCIEQLESRIAPAIFTVTTLNDTTDAMHDTGSLRDALALADASPGADTIKFNLPPPPPLPPPAAGVPGVNILKLNGTELASAGNVTIVGPGAGKLIIDGHGQSRIFDFNDNASSADSPVSISGLSIVNGHATGGVGSGHNAQNDYGGGIYSAESLTLKKVVLFGNNADGNGGGVAVSGNGRDTKVNISNSLITHNTAAGYAGGVDVFDVKLVTISNTNVTGNTASGGFGGGIYLGNSTAGKGIIVTDCVISGNTASYAGGLSVNNFGTGKTTISGTKITGNISTDTSGNYGGGGVTVRYGDTVITGCTISNNTAVYDGGGVFAYEFKSLVISKCTISGNQTTATNAAGQGGGGICIYGSSYATPQKVTITKSQIKDNVSAEDGGGVFAKNGIALSVSNSTFSGNHADGIGGGIATRGNLLNKVNLTVTGGEFSGNTADAGGGISAEGDSSPTGDGAFSLTGSKVTGNTARVVGGGVEVTTNGDVTVKNATIAGNVGTNYGGGLSISVSKNFVVSGGSITGNSSHRGGGVWAYQSKGSITGVTISGNAAQNDAGGVNSANSDVTLQVAKVTGNTAPSAPNFSGVTASGPYAHAPAAGHIGIVVTTVQDVVDANDGVISLREALAQADLTPDTVDTISFALPAADFVNGAWIIKLNGTELSSKGNVNITGPGAGKLIIDGDAKSRVLFISDGSAGTDKPATISGLSVIDGNASGDGGGILCFESLTLKSGVVSGNTSTSNSGGIYAGGSSAAKVDISNSFFTGNSTTGSDGAIRARGSSITLTQTVVTGNTSTAGGAISTVFASTPTGEAITDCLVSGNTAGYGAGLAVFGPADPNVKVTISSTKITGNTANSIGSAGGAGLYIGSGNVVLTGSKISNNESSSDGGGVKVQTFTSLAISKSTISGNRSASSGGGILAQGDATNPLESVTITKSVIADNRAANGNGGGVSAFGGVALNIFNSTVTGNHASDRGGGVSSVDSLNVSGGTFADNTAEYGGGIRATGVVTISKAKITGNIAAKAGGGVYANGGTGTASLLKNSFAGNFANTGGGVFINTTPAFAISGGSFTGNSALEGGAIELGASAGSIDALITGNAANRGGGVFNQSATASAITLHIAKIIANTAVTAPNVGDDPGDLSTFHFV